MFRIGKALLLARLSTPLILLALRSRLGWLLRCRFPRRRIVPVFYRRPLHLRRGVRQTIELVVGVGAALFLSYLILQTRW